jgi:serpin B
MLLIGCGEPDVLVARQLPAAIRADAAQVAAGNNQLACDVYSKLPAGNTIFSPFSIATAFAMLDAGAAGTTDAELRTALHVTLPGDKLHAAYGALLTSLDTGRGYGTYTLATADRLFGAQGAAFQPAFLATTKTDYHAPLQPLDFASDPDGSRAQIDSWVASQTDNLIPELFPPGSIPPATRLVVANAIVFKGTWEQQFDPASTGAGSFHVAGGTAVTAQLMHAHDAPIATAPIPGGQLGVLPFRGKDLAMLVILPDTPDGLPGVEAQLTGAAITTAVQQAGDGAEPRDVTLPKFHVELHTTLDPILQALGVHAVFDPATADLSGIDGARDLYVDTALHDAVISVDEEGAEAAAATGVGVTPTAGPEPFIVDHSFAYAIYDQVTGSILFMGRVQDPTQ